MSETNFKFFLQLVSYASVYCLHVLVVMAILVAEVIKDVSGLPSNLLHDQGSASVCFVAQSVATSSPSTAYLLCLQFALGYIKALGSSGRLFRSYQGRYLRPPWLGRSPNNMYSSTLSSAADMCFFFRIGKSAERSLDLGTELVSVFFSIYLTRLTPTQGRPLLPLFFWNGCSLNAASLDQLHHGGKPDTKDSGVAPSSARTRIISASVGGTRWTRPHLQMPSYCNLPSPSVDTNRCTISCRDRYSYLPQRSRSAAYHFSATYIRRAKKQTRH